MGHLPEADAVEHAQRWLVAFEDLAQYALPRVSEAFHHGGEDRRPQAAAAPIRHQGDIDDAAGLGPQVDHDGPTFTALPMMSKRRGKLGAVRRRLRTAGGSRSSASSTGIRGKVPRWCGTGWRGWLRPAPACRG